MSKGKNQKLAKHVNNVKKYQKCGDFHVDHDISCETQLLELVSLNSVGHPVLWSSCCPSFSVSIVSPDNCLTAQTCAPATDRNLESDCVMLRPSSTAQEKSRSVTRPRMVAELVVTITEPGSVRGYCVRRWNLMDQLAQRLQHLETHVGQQRAVIEHQQEQLMRQQTTIDAERAARTPVNPAQDARINLVDLRVGNKWETFAGETHEWKGSSFKMRQYIAAVDEELYLELVHVEANPLREMPLAGMNEPQKRRARQLAFMLAMHTKDRALQITTKLSDPSNGFEIWRRFLEEWEPAHRGRYRAMLMQLLQFPFTGDRGQALEEWERLVRQYEAQSSDTLQYTIKAAILAHNPQDPEWRRHVGLNAARI